MTEENQMTTSTKVVGPGDLVALDGSVYRILSYQGNGTLFVEAEDIETFERVLLTTAEILPWSPTTSTNKKRHRRRDRRRIFR